MCSGFSSRILLLFLLSCPVFAPGDLPNRLAQSYQEHWGYGFGANCNLRFAANSNLYFLFADQGKIIIQDQGFTTRTEHYPHQKQIITWRRDYNFIWQGTWENKEEEQIIHLGMRTHFCRERFSRRGNYNQLCPSYPVGLTLLCKIKAVKLMERRGTEASRKEVNALVCQAGRPQDYRGTEFPWIFGMEEHILVLKAGGPGARRLLALSSDKEIKSLEKAEEAEPPRAEKTLSPKDNQGRE